MRGARGLLISISGGPDLTLYEVDEAATRIREEVDPEANIILGATFDDTLEGTMRVSVVATGLALEGVEHSDEQTKKSRPIAKCLATLESNLNRVKVVRPSTAGTSPGCFGRKGD